MPFFSCLKSSYLGRLHAQDTFLSVVFAGVFMGTAPMVIAYIITCKNCKFNFCPLLSNWDFSNFLSLCVTSPSYTVLLFSASTQLLLLVFSRARCEHSCKQLHFQEKLFLMFYFTIVTWTASQLKKGSVDSPCKIQLLKIICG